MNDELSPREHADMRDMVLAGAQRIRPKGRHRTQLVAAAIALVLVGGVTGGAVMTAALLSADQAPAPAETSTPTPTAPTPTPGPEPTQAPDTKPDQAVEGVVAFDGECANILTESEVSTSMGRHMIHFGAPWSMGHADVLGGIECRWIDAMPNPTPFVQVAVYPQAVIPSGFAATDGVVCETIDDMRACRVTGTFGPTWYSIVTAPGSGDTADVVRALEELLVSRLENHGTPTPAEATDEWWRLPTCERLRTVDVGAYLGSSGALTPTPVEWAMRPEWVTNVPRATERLDYCEWVDANRSRVTARILPGGGASFPAIAASETAQPVSVPGATDAVVVEEDDAWEGYYPALVATDGINLIVVQRSGMDPQEVSAALEYADLTAAFLAALGS